MSKFDDSPACACPLMAIKGKCGEYETLEVMEQFRRFYENKLHEIDIEGGGDCLELKLKVQQRWIDDLTEQTEMMARIVKELENEATDRVQILEEKLRQTSKAAYELTKERKEKEEELSDLKCRIVELEMKLEDAKAQMCCMRPCVDMITRDTMIDDELAARKKEMELEDEICQRQCEVAELKCKCQELEKALSNSQGRAENLQKAEYRLGTRGELRKLRQQKRCYEQVVERFKQEMAVMSEQLIHLQEILKLSNQSCKEENGQLYNAVTDLQKLSERLQDQLIETEKKVIIENQMNQMKDAKIDELQLIIGQKNADLNIHDEAIHKMKNRLENSILENHDLQATIVSLNSTIMQLQCSLQAQETEKLEKVETCKSQIHLCKKSICDFQEDLERKSKQLEMLQGDYKAQYELFKAAQFELEQVKEKTKEKLKQMKLQNEGMKEKLVTSEMHNQHLSEELASLREQTTQIAQRECCREQELAQCKQTIIELRQTLIELNESLADSELHNMALVEEFKKSKTENRQQEDIYLSCRCEITLYKKLAENFKTSLIQARKSLTEAEAANKSLKDEIKSKEIKLNEIQKKLLKKDRDTCQTVRELNEKLKQSQMEQKRLCEFIENLKNEIKGKSGENTANGYCPCEEIANTQEEINSLKGDIKNMIQNQIALNTENDKLLKQVSCLQSTVNCVEERNRLLKEKLEKTLAENQTLKETNQILLYQRNKLGQSVKNLESELADARNNCDDICAESRHVVNNVKAWLEEQKRINDCVKMKTQCYCNTIQKLKQENENLLGQQSRAKSPSPILKNKTNKPATQFRTCSPVCYQNWNLGSQGTGSYDESPRGSPSSFLTCSVEEWYSPNYRDDDETDDREILAEDEFIARLETATLEMKSSNRKLKNKCAECLVSRDKVK